jgi:type II secretory pathway pseudopilin PulG
VTGRGRRGTTYIELLGAIVVIGLALLAGSGVLVSGRRIAARMERRALAMEAIASEIALLSVTPPAEIPEGSSPWKGGLDVAAGLPKARGTLVVEPFRGTGVRRVRVSLSWGNGESRVSEILLPGGAK